MKQQKHLIRVLFDHLQHIVHQMTALTISNFTRFNGHVILPHDNV